MDVGGQPIVDANAYDIWWKSGGENKVWAETDAREMSVRDLDVIWELKIGSREATYHVPSDQ
jgi:hypothetical protein